MEAVCLGPTAPVYTRQGLVKPLQTTATPLSHYQLGTTSQLRPTPLQYLGSKCNGYLPRASMCLTQYHLTYCPSLRRTCSYPRTASSKRRRKGWWFQPKDSYLLSLWKQRSLQLRLPTTDLELLWSSLASQILWKGREHKGEQLVQQHANNPNQRRQQH